jgi:hypothetical protein
MQDFCFYRFSAIAPFSGNARLLLLPFSSHHAFFGQCRASAFTVFHSSRLYRAMQGFCFYRFSAITPFSGNAGLLLLPFFILRVLFGQCSASAFTVFHPSPFFRAMQGFCFYRFSSIAPFSSNAELLLLPLFSHRPFFGQCSASAFTAFYPPRPFRAMQGFCFYRFSAIAPFSGNARLLLLLFFSHRAFFGQCRASAFTAFQPSHLFRQCRASAFTVFHPSPFFRAMQGFCFYRFLSSASFSGNAGLLLLPFFILCVLFGQCRASAFTAFHPSHLFRAMQGFCFYRFLSRHLK